MAVRGQPGLGLRWLALGTLVCCAPSLAAQELALKRDYPGSGPFVCPSVELPALAGEEERIQATQLASSADQALVLGDLTRASVLLARATELDPTSAELAYRRGRVLEDLGDRPAAIASYCRVLAQGSTGYTAADADARLQSLVVQGRATISAEASEAFRAGLAWADLGRLDDAVRAFDAAVAQAPAWAEAVFNRAVVLDRMGQSLEALAGLRQYLAFSPDAEDAVEVAGRIGRLEGASAAAPSAGTALTLGIVIPGAGQFYSGRAVGGLAVLSLAGGAAAAGLLIKEVQVQCLATVGPGESCPPGQVYGEEVDRPYLIPALGVAAGVAVIGAIEAFVKARGSASGGDALSAPAAPGELRLAGPTVSTRGARVDLSFVRVTF